MEKKIYGIIYLLIDGTNDCEYIGQTTRSVEVRFKEHEKMDSCIGKAILVHGADMFIIVILKICYSKEELDFWEKHFIRSRDTKYPNGYNRSYGGEGGNKSTNKTQEKNSTPKRCEKISASRIGDKNPNYGKHFAKSTCSKLSISNRGKSQYKNLLSEIDAHQFTYVSLAELMGLSFTSISRKMLGKRNFTGRDKVKLVEIFGKPIDYLLTHDDG